VNNFGCRAVPRTAADALVGLRFECFGEPNQSAAASPRFVVTGISIGEDAPSPQLVGAAVLMKQPANKL
jgi:hypothetical protein